MKTSKKILSSSISLFFLSLYAPIATAVEAPLVADSYINAMLPSNNFGSTTALNIGNGNATFLTFNVQTLPAGTTSAQIAKATMLLWVDKIGAAGAIDVLPVTAAWAEDGITFNTAPSAGNIAAATAPIMTASQFVVVDVTELVKSWVDYPSLNFGVKISAANGQPLTVVSFDSKENRQTSHAPRLDITLVNEGQKGDPGETGPKGDTGDNGVKGDKGDKGDQGIQGLKGDKGDQGIQGVKGDKGDQGIQGVKGDKGDQGIQGVKGDKGDKGDQGIQGVKGDKGDQGIQGPQGPRGNDGTNGTNGNDGALTAWSRTGNAGTVDGVNFIGTTDNAPFNIRVNNQKAGRIDANKDSTFYGYLAGESNTGMGNTANGFNALLRNTSGQYNVAVGSSSLYNNTSGSNNVALGYVALPRNTVGTNNVAIGLGLYQNTEGSRNVAIGDYASYANITGSRNVAVGYSALSGGPSNITASTSIGDTSQIGGNSATAIGADTLAYADNTTAIGAGAKAYQANTMKFGNDAITTIHGKVNFTATSDSRQKEDIQPLDYGSNFLMKLRPVSYRMKNSTDTRRNWGFIAQDIETLLGNDNAILTVGGDEDRTLGLRYTDFIAPLIKTVQEQEEMIKTLEKKNAALETAMENENSKLKTQIQNLKAEFGELIKKMGVMLKGKESAKQ